MAKKPKPAKKAKPAKPAKPAKKSGGKKSASASKEFKPRQPSSLPTASQVATLVNQCSSLKSQSRAPLEDLSTLIRNACETKHFDRRALSIARGLYDLKPDRLAITLPHLLFYIEALKLGKIAKTQGELALAKPELGEDEPGERSQRKKAAKNGNGEKPAADPKTDNVVSLTNPKLMPSDQEVKDAADRAEARAAETQVH